MKWVTVFCAVMLLSGMFRSEAVAQADRWSLGGFVSYNSPMFEFGERFSRDVNKWGVNVSYVPGDRMAMELEYHRSKLTDGTLETRTVTWQGKEWAALDVNPDARYEMTFNSLLLSALIHRRGGRSMEEGSFSPYLAVGAGYYKHHAVAENIFWPGQSEPQARAANLGTDRDGDILPGVMMMPQRDTRTALTASFGVGMEAFLTPTIAVDVRGRYHLIISELRPYDDWFLKKSFPLQMMDLSAGFKFYFWN